MALHTEYEIRWKNYRAFEDTDWIKIRPLTVLIGPNNSGKTSIVSPLLLLSQTILSSDSVTPLVTRGPLVDAGSFKNLVHNHDTSKALFLGLRYHLHEEKGKVSKIGTYPPGGIELTLKEGASGNIALQSFALFDVLRRPFLRESRNRNGTYSLKSDAFKLVRREEREAARRTRPVNFLFSSSSPLRELQSQGKETSERVSQVLPSRGFLMYVSALSSAFGELADLFRDQLCRPSKRAATPLLFGRGRNAYFRRLARRAHGQFDKKAATRIEGSAEPLDSPVRIRSRTRRGPSIG